MNKKILLLALLPASPAFAQTKAAHEETRPQPVATVQEQEIQAKERSLAVYSSAKEEPVFFSTPETLGRLKEYVDYFPAEALLDGKTDLQVPHEISSTQRHNVRLNLEGMLYEELDVYLIHDRYRIRADNELPGDFQYNNTYFLYRNKEGTALATIIYVECAIGGMKTEYKIVKKGLPAVAQTTLSLAPNPTQRDLTITSRITNTDGYSLQITGLEGRSLMTIFDKKQLAPGQYTHKAALSLPAGTYLVVLRPEHAAPITQKLIIK